MNCSNMPLFLTFLYGRVWWYRVFVCWNVCGGVWRVVNCCCWISFVVHAFLAFCCVGFVDFLIKHVSTMALTLLLPFHQTDEDTKYYNICPNPIQTIVSKLHCILFLRMIEKRSLKTINNTNISIKSLLLFYERN